MAPLVVHTRRSLARLALVLPLVALAACEDEADPVGPGSGDEIAVGQTVTTAPINATSSDTLVYYSLARNTIVPRTGDWDIALRRYEIRLNSAATAGATNKGVTAAALNNGNTLTNEQVLALTVDNTLAAFNGVTAAQIAGATFAGDVLTENRSAYLNFAGAAPSANATAYWKTRTASGGYALFHVTGITYTPSNDLASITIESRLQNGATLGAAQSVTVPLNGTTPANVSFATNSAVTANGCNWDVRVDPRVSESFAITLNTGCNVATYPGASSPTFGAATTANDAPTYAAYLSALTGPIPNGVTSAPHQGIAYAFRYNLTGNNRLSPTFNTYLVRSGTNVYKLQMINYYSTAGTSGWPTLRYARLQ